MQIQVAFAQKKRLAYYQEPPHFATQDQQKHLAQLTPSMVVEFQ
jgi:hypothetical protein